MLAAVAQAIRSAACVAVTVASRRPRCGAQRLAEGAGGPNLTWVARDVLAGKFDLRQLTSLSMLRDEVEQHFNQLRAWKDEIGSAEFERQAQAAKDTMTAARAELDLAADEIMRPVRDADGPD